VSQPRTIQVTRRARYYLAGEGDGPVREAWLLLHGYGQLAAPFLESCAALAAPGRLLIAPEALSRFYLRSGTGPVGASWMTRVEREDEIADSLAYLEQVLVAALGERAGALPLGVLGFSQGAAAAARLALLGGPRPQRVVLWAGHLPPELELAQASSLAWTLVRGASDQALSPETFEGDLGRLQAAGARVERLDFAGGHELDAGLLRGLRIAAEPA